MERLIEMISNVKGCQFANITFIGDGGIPKKVINGKVTKIVKTECQLNYSYENAVNNRLEKIGEERNFKAQSLPYGEWIKGYENKLIEHKNEIYLRYYNVPNKKADETIWLVDDRLATDEEKALIFSYLKAKKEKEESKTQFEKGLKENQVQVRTTKVKNIIRLAVNGCEYIKKEKEEFMIR